MNRTLISAMLLSFVAVFSISARCHAETYVEFEHDWTVQSFAGTYGLQGIGSTTYLCWGQGSVRISVHPYALVASLVADMLVLLAVGWFAGGAFARHRPRASS